MVNLNFTSCKSCGSVLDLDVIASKIDVDDYYLQMDGSMRDGWFHYDKYDTQEFHPLHPCPCCGEKIVVKNLTL